MVGLFNGKPSIGIEMHSKDSKDPIMMILGKNQAIELLKKLACNIGKLHEIEEELMREQKKNLVH